MAPSHKKTDILMITILIQSYEYILHRTEEKTVRY